MLLIKINYYIPRVVSIGFYLYMLFFFTTIYLNPLKHLDFIFNTSNTLFLFEFFKTIVAIFISVAFIKVRYISKKDNSNNRENIFGSILNGIVLFGIAILAIYIFISGFYTLAVFNSDYYLILIVILNVLVTLFTIANSPNSGKGEILLYISAIVLTLFIMNTQVSHIYSLLNVNDIMIPQRVFMPMFKTIHTSIFWGFIFYGFLLLSNIIIILKDIYIFRDKNN